MPDNQAKAWTIRELMKSAIEHLQKQGIENARLNIELLLAHALDYQRIQLYLNFDKPLTPEELKRFRTLYERRLKREPVQYIIGSVKFMGLNFFVDPRVLIPRPETETLIEQIILISRSFPDNKPIRFLEIGTGSGNIAVSIAKFIKNADITAIDISFEALAVARQNASLNSVESKINFSCIDVFDESEILLKSQYDIIVSNPPYVPRDEWEQLQVEVRDFEPSTAVTDGKDGFKFHNRIIEMIPGILSPGGGVVLEIGFGQANTVIDRLKEAGLEDIEVVNDLQGIPRVIIGRWQGLPSTYISLN